MDLYAGQLKTLHFNSSEKSQEWTDITDVLDMPVVLKDGFVTFQVKISAGKIYIIFKVHCLYFIN